MITSIFIGSLTLSFVVVQLLSDSRTLLFSIVFPVMLSPLSTSLQRLEYRNLNAFFVFLLSLTFPLEPHQCLLFSEEQNDMRYRQIPMKIFEVCRTRIVIGRFSSEVGGILLEHSWALGSHVMCRLV